ncbi:hypothetical protein [Desulfitobacterium metallireducens]|uniref:Uncharacterized protein n=1 Tax=Desulfitobacterium metallireducens DSM 15288 TaxID=871968 RepID=W0EAT4_9FIRM|nr:hypothetical protein [Desulfitobacterium metallireducens]AHF06324.1 hypothetical protein DESME_04050 [Desulfitobacterium metallireducens DSM 15288]
MWTLNSKGEKEFVGGKEDWEGAAKAAANCLVFKEDVEEELVADELRSCYNCRNRRWTSMSFVCYGSK